VVNLDDIWKWVGFSRKVPAKRLLEKYFKINTDYILENFASADAEAKIPGVHENQQLKNFAPQFGGTKNIQHDSTSPDMNNATDDTEARGGSNRETILMTINAFKKFCLKANTWRADQIHDYYIRLEELLHETITEQANDVQNRLEGIITQKEREIRSLSRQVIKKYQEKYRSGKCLYFVRSPEIRGKFKIGSTNNIDKRFMDFNTGSPQPFETIQLFYTPLRFCLEQLIKQQFSRRRVSLNCEWYDLAFLPEIQGFVTFLALCRRYDEHSDLDRIQDFFPTAESTRSDDASTDHSETSTETSEILTDQPETSPDAPADPSEASMDVQNTTPARPRPIYENEKECQACHRSSTTACFSARTNSPGRTSTRVSGATRKSTAWPTQNSVRGA
jgi:hypothetical protein